MKILCDAHLPQKLAEFFNQHNIEAIHVSNILESWQTKDQNICRFADENDYTVVTKDRDFRNSHFLQGTPRKLIKINLGNISNDILIDVFNTNLPLLIKVFECEQAYVELDKEYVSTFI